MSLELSLVLCIFFLEYDWLHPVSGSQPPVVSALWDLVLSSGLSGCSVALMCYTENETKNRAGQEGLHCHDYAVVQRQ